MWYVPEVAEVVCGIPWLQVSAMLEFWLTRQLMRMNKHGTMMWQCFGRM